MKRLSLIILSIGFFTFFSCETENGPEVPYYQFTEAENDLIISFDYVPDQVIIYENQFGERLRFKVISNESKKRNSYSIGTLSGGGGGLTHHFDSKIVRLEIIENPSSGYYSTVNYIFSKKRNTFQSGMCFPLWNVIKFYILNFSEQDAFNIPMTQQLSKETSNMTVNGHRFSRVLRLDSGSTEVENNDDFGPLEQKVNTLFYDLDFGIVGFDDLDGNEWRVIYPE